MSEVKLTIKQEHVYNDGHSIIKGGTVFKAVKDGFEAFVSSDKKDIIELLEKGYGAVKEVLEASSEDYAEAFSDFKEDEIVNENEAKSEEDNDEEAENAAKEKAENAKSAENAAKEKAENAAKVKALKEEKAAKAKAAREEKAKVKNENK